MNPLSTPDTALPSQTGRLPSCATRGLPGEMQRVLRNTYALMALTLLFSAGMASATLALAPLGFSSD